MAFVAPSLIPELDVADLDRSLAVYLNVLGFSCHVRRPEEKFAYLIREGAHLMLEEAGGPGRRFDTAALEYPFGRGVNLQIEVSDVDARYASVKRSELTIRIPLEERWYRHNGMELGNRQFVVADPDGYLLRFFSSLGRRPVQQGRVGQGAEHHAHADQAPETRGRAFAFAHPTTAAPACRLSACRRGV
jgi:catechol 2,3-dioxygenase-like lactoylglutathione lyase family enzyme